MLDTIKKYTGIKKYQDYVENVEDVENKKDGTGLEFYQVTKDDEVFARATIELGLSSEKGAYKGKTFKEASEGVVFLESKKQNCCQCVSYSFENILQKFWLNRGYIPKNFITDVDINYSLFNVKENAMVGMIPSKVYDEYVKNGAVPYILEKDVTKNKFKDWYPKRSSNFVEDAKDLRITFFGKKIAEHKGFFSFNKFENALETARVIFGKENVMFRISKKSAVGVVWYNTDIPYLDASKEFRYLNGGHSMAGDGEIGIYETEEEKSVYIYESYGKTRFHYLKKSIFDLVVIGWEIYVDKKKIVKLTIKKNLIVEDKYDTEYKKVSKRCFKNKPCKNIKSQVFAIQEKLGIIADGKFGLITAKKVREFQKKNKLKQDGVVGSKTWKMLFN